MSLQIFPFPDRNPLAQSDRSPVLVVEDDSGDEFFILRSLKSLQINSDVIVARDGEEATNYIFRHGEYVNRQGEPCVIMLDLCIPKIAGLEVLRQIKEDPSTKHIPVVVMTSSESKVDIERCYALGANSVVRKGRFIEEFRESVAVAVTYWTQVNVRA